MVAMEEVTAPALLEAASALLGPLRLVRDRSRPHQEAMVLEAVSGEHGRLFLKSHRQALKYETELRAYREVVPQLGGRAPRLLGAHEPYRLLLLSAVAGAEASASGPVNAATHERAGALLATLHAAGMAGMAPASGWHETLAARLERWIERGHGALLAREVEQARAEVAAAAGIEPPTVAAHWDFQPRNWIVDGATVSLIDFEHLRPDAWEADLQKLWWHEWSNRPVLRQAFLRGYGVTLHDIDPVPFRALAATHLLATVVWAHDHRDAGYGRAARSGLRVLAARPGLPV